MQRIQHRWARTSVHRRQTLQANIIKMMVILLRAFVWYRWWEIGDGDVESLHPDQSTVLLERNASCLLAYVVVKFLKIAPSFEHHSPGSQTTHYDGILKDWASNHARRHHQQDHPVEKRLVKLKDAVHVTVTPSLTRVEGIERIKVCNTLGFNGRAVAFKHDPSKSEMASGHIAGSPYLYMAISLPSVCWCCMRETRSWLCSSKGIEKAWVEVFLWSRLAEGAVDEATLLLLFLSFLSLASNGLHSSSVAANPTFWQKKDNSLLARCTFTTALDKPPMQLSKWSSHVAFK